MILISHRGNICGPNPKRENSPSYVLEAIGAGYNVEVDVWLINDEFYLGHDKPIHGIDLDFLVKNFNSLWCHAKDIDALSTMIHQGIHCFWHQTDDVTLTSKGYLWTYPGKQLTRNSIAVLPEYAPPGRQDIIRSGCYGVCSDLVEHYRTITV
jgi:hypothetical protein